MLARQCALKDSTNMTDSDYSKVMGRNLNKDQWLLIFGAFYYELLDPKIILRKFLVIWVPSGFKFPSYPKFCFMSTETAVFLASWYFFVYTELSCAYQVQTYTWAAFLNFVVAVMTGSNHQATTLNSIINYVVFNMADLDSIPSNSFML